MSNAPTLGEEPLIGYYYRVQNGANSFWRGISVSWRSIIYPSTAATSLSFIEWNGHNSQSGNLDLTPEDGLQLSHL